MNFSRHQRLLSSRDYKKVFEQPIKRFKTPFFLLLSKPNERDFGRIGVIVPKKQLKKSVARNKIKRMAKESFRLKQHDLKGHDIVFLVYRKIEIQEKAEIKKCLDEALVKLGCYLK